MSEFVLCCVSQTSIDSTCLEEIKTFLQSKNAFIKGTKDLTNSAKKALDLVVDFPLNFETQKIKSDLTQLAAKHKIDMALMANDKSRTDKKLIVFDMDSTLIQHEVIDEMAMVHGIGDKVKLITERTMNGELNFDEALKERVSLLKGLKRESMDSIMLHLKVSPGVPELISAVKKQGYKTAVISGGFKYFAENFKTKLGMDYAFANDLEWDQNVLSGRVVGKIINAQEKARLLDELAQKEKISLQQIVAVGDGANDLPMLGKAGFGIAYHAKEKVRKEAKHQMSFGPMTTLLYFLGIPGNHDL